MKARFNRTTWRAVAGIAASFTLLVSFQNCGKAGFDSDLGSELDLGSNAELTSKYGVSTAEKVTKIPFAFEANLDTITYNSCAHKNLPGKEGYFTVKAGSYSTGGIKLKSEFYSYVDENFVPVYPATSLSNDDYKQYLQDSPINNRLTPTLSMRAKNSLTDVYYNAASGSLALNKDIIPMVSELTNPLVSESFVNKGVTSSYFRFSPDLRVMEGALSFNNDEGQADRFRSDSSNSVAMTLTYLPPNQEVYKVAAANTNYPVKTAYGKSYNFGFSTGGSKLNRVLSSVYEIDLASPSNSKRDWNCSRSYKVVRVEDAAIYCPTMTQAEIETNPAYRAELEVLRRHLRADQWDVNVSKRCVVPKTVSCYDEGQVIAGTPAVQYDVSQNCYPQTATALSQCLHYISICVR